MNTLSYYENYRVLARKITLIRGQLQFFAISEEREQLITELDRCLAAQKEIEENLEHYIPYTLPCRSYFKALEERQFLFYRCIRGLTMMQTAELMCVSRDTAYRIRRRLAAHEGVCSMLGNE